MQAEPVLPVSPELTDKLHIMESEAEFEAYKPRRPYHWWPVALSAAMTIAMGLIAYDSWRAHPETGSERFWFFMFFVMQFLVQAGQYASQRRAFRIHTLACELIAYYKKKAQLA